MAASSHLAGRDQRAACPDQPPVLPITLIQVGRVWVLSITRIQAGKNVRCLAWRRGSASCRNPGLIFPLPPPPAGPSRHRQDAHSAQRILHPL